MAKIRKDEYSLYVIKDGKYYRPLYPFGYKHLYKTLKNGISVFSERDKVKVSTHRGSPLCEIKSEKIVETWFCLGYTMDGDSRKSLLNHPEYLNL